MKSYDYSHRKGAREITCQDFSNLAAHLTEMVDRAAPDIIVGIARAGLFPATALACALRREMYPIRVSRRVNDEVTFDDPVWRTPVTFDVEGKTVAVVDEIADSGRTLALVAEELRSKGAEKVISACLASHTWASPPPDYTALVTDELVIFPWDKQVYSEGRWQPHPEITAALGTQADRAAAPTERVVELRRHAMRVIPQARLSQAGVDLARRVGQGSGKFDRVITSTVPRAYETAIAMGYAVDEQQELLARMAEEVNSAIRLNASFSEAARVVVQGGPYPAIIQSQIELLLSVARSLPPGGRALLISHGGIIESIGAALMPHADHAAWGPACSYCEGLRLVYNEDSLIQAEVLRLPDALNQGII